MGTSPGLPRLCLDLSGEGARGGPSPNGTERVTLDDLTRLDPRAPFALARLLVSGRREEVVLRLRSRSSAQHDRLLAGVGLLARAPQVSVEYACEGERAPLGRLEALSALARVALEAVSASSVVRRARARARILVRRAREKQTPSLRPGPALLLRTDMDAWVSAGGSIAHLSGILQALSASGYLPTLVTPARPRGLDLGVPWLLAPRSRIYTGSRELGLLSYDDQILPWLRRRLRRERPALLYERYGPGSLAGALFASPAGIPHVLEYNGSETWVARRWGGRPLLYEETFAAIEKAALLSADVVSVVSKPLEREAIARGVSPERVVLAPNGVEPERFDLERLSARRLALRASLGWDEDALVLGFVGSFGPWHGAEVLAEAFSLLERASRDPDFARELLPDEKARSVLPRLRLLLVGEGERLAPSKIWLEHALERGRARVTGLVPQSEAPYYLFASDLLVSPHVPNPDGTAFFGSPTKLFEYMASGRPIVASDLDQVGEVLRPALTLQDLESGASSEPARAVLVPPGNARALARALASLAARSATGAGLGKAAREAVLREFTWEKTLGRVLERLGSLGLHRERHAPPRAAMVSGFRGG